MGTAMDIRAFLRSALSARVECPDVKITNDGLTRSDTGCLSVPIWQQWALKG